MKRTVLAVLVLVVMYTPAAKANTFVVGPGDVSGLISARHSANDETGSPGPDEIVLATDSTYSLTVQSENSNGLPAITSPISIFGHGSTVERRYADGTSYFRIIHVAASGDLTLDNVTIRNGSLLGSSPWPKEGGCVFVEGTLTLRNRTMVTDCETPGSGGGIGTESATTRILDSSVTNNSAGFAGGGVWEHNGNLEIVRSTVAGNRSPVGLGGGVVILRSYAEIRDSLVAGNSVYEGSGGIHIEDQAIVMVINSTVSGNSVDEDSPFGTAGGIQINSGVVSILNSTITNNSAAVGSGVWFYARSEPTVTIENSIVANGSGGDCFNAGPGSALGGNNRDSDGSCPDSTPITGLDPALADNGGPTLTHALLPGSSAIDAAVDCPPPTADQRGIVRPQDGDGDSIPICDIGAFEIEASVLDSDGDGVPDTEDACPGTAVGDVVEANGCSIAQLCPCEDPESLDLWKNHGEYVSCVAHATNLFIDLGLISEDDKGAIVTAAALSTCGRRNK